jgi:hypothetical protein
MLRAADNERGKPPSSGLPLEYGKAALHKASSSSIPFVAVAQPELGIFRIAAFFH